MQITVKAEQWRRSPSQGALYLPINSTTTFAILLTADYSRVFPYVANTRHEARKHALDVISEVVELTVAPGANFVDFLLHLAEACLGHLNNARREGDVQRRPFESRFTTLHNSHDVQASTEVDEKCGEVQMCNGGGATTGSNQLYGAQPGSSPFGRDSAASYTRTRVY